MDKIQDVIKRYSPNHDGNLSMRNDDPCKVYVVPTPMLFHTVNLILIVLDSLLPAMPSD